MSKKQKPEVYDFDHTPASDPLPQFPFPKEDKSSAREVAWLIFSRLYVRRLNAIMCIAPVGFRDELEQNFEIICAPHGRRYVMFECDDECEKILPEHFERIMKNKDMVKMMLVRASSLYPGTAMPITEDEAMILATALGVDGVGKMIPLKLEDGNPWSPV